MLQHIKCTVRILACQKINLTENLNELIMESIVTNMIVGDRYRNLTCRKICQRICPVQLCHLDNILWDISHRRQKEDHIVT